VAVSRNFNIDFSPNYSGKAARGGWSCESSALAFLLCDKTELSAEWVS